MAELEEEQQEESCDPESGSSSGSDGGPELGQIRRLSSVAAAGGILSATALACLLFLSVRSPQEVVGAMPLASSRSLDVVRGFDGSKKQHLPITDGFIGSTTMTTTTRTKPRIPEALAPPENRHDGNVCETGEELFKGLCYKTCSLLTSGEYPLRTTPFSCCSQHPCNLKNQKFELGLCGGFDVAGDEAGGGCPHPPGACLENEELSLGVCYKKCGILTNNEFPYRLAAATCCKVQGLGCLDFTKTRTSKAFDVGGGEGDGDWATPASPHAPLKELTEDVSI